MVPLYSYKGKYSINEITFRVEDKEFENRLVGRVIYPRTEYPTIRDTLLNVGFFILGLYGLSTTKTLWVILGLIACGIGGFNIFDIFKGFKNPKYIVWVSMRLEDSNKMIRLVFDEEESATEFCRILEAHRS